MTAIEAVYPISAIEIDIRRELERQDNKWGIQNHTPERWMTILGEEFGEACKAHLDNDKTNYETELIQVAAVAIQALYNFRQQQRKS